MYVSFKKYLFQFKDKSYIFIITYLLFLTTSCNPSNVNSSNIQSNYNNNYKQTASYSFDIKKGFNTEIKSIKGNVEISITSLGKEYSFKGILWIQSPSYLRLEIKSLFGIPLAYIFATNEHFYTYLPYLKQSVYFLDNPNDLLKKYASDMAKKDLNSNILKEIFNILLYKFTTCNDDSLDLETNNKTTTDHFSENLFKCREGNIEKSFEQHNNKNLISNIKYNIVPTKDQNDSSLAQNDKKYTIINSNFSNFSNYTDKGTEKSIPFPKNIDISILDIANITIIWEKDFTLNDAMDSSFFEWTPPQNSEIYSIEDVIYSWQNLKSN